MSPAERKDSPTVSTCPACKGRRRRVHETPDGRRVEEVCSWCEGCGFIVPERLAEWEVFSRKKPAGV